MSLTLFRREVRAHWVLALVFAAVMTLYGSMIVSMFDPKLGESLAMMAESMPQIFAAFNMTDPGATLTEFLANYLYGFLFVVLPMVAILILAAGLVARWRGCTAGGTLVFSEAGRPGDARRGPGD